MNAFEQGLRLIEQAYAKRDLDTVEATACAFQALHLFQQIPSRRGQGLAHLALASLCLQTGDLAEARDHAQDARDLFAEIPLARMEADARTLLGEIMVRFGDLAAADQEFNSAMELAAGHGTPGEVAELHRRLGSLQRRAGRIGSAMQHYQQAAALYASVADEHGLAGVLLSLANTLSALGQWQEAIPVYRESARLFEATRDRHGAANARRFIGQALVAQGDDDAAAAELDRALETYRIEQDILGQAHTQLLLAEMALRAQFHDVAMQQARQAAELFRRLSDPVPLVACIGVLESCLAESGDSPALLETLAWGVGEARQAARWSVDREGARRAQELIADLEDRALRLAVELGDAVQAGVVMESAVTGVMGLLPVLLEGPASKDPKVEALRAQVRELARNLALRAPEDPPAPPADAADEGDPPTRSFAQGAPDEVIRKLEDLLGRRAREMLTPPRRDLAAVVRGAWANQIVVQYHCPLGIGEGRQLYVVVSTPGKGTGVTATTLSRTLAERLNVLRGARLVAGEAEDVVDGTVAEMSAVRGLGAGVALDRQLARRTMELWAALDRPIQADPAVRELADALFPPALMAALGEAREELPPRLLVVPSPWLWNLPWAGLMTPSGQRLVECARTSLTFSLSALGDQPWQPIRTVAAWIPGGSDYSVRGTVVERTMVNAMFGDQALTPSPESFVAVMGRVDAAFISVHGKAPIGLAHGLQLDEHHLLTAAGLVAVDVPGTLVIGACWSSRIEPNAEPFAIPLIAHARGATDIIGGVFPLPDAPPFPTARLLTQLYPALLGTDPGTALWLAQHEALQAGAAPHSWAGMIHTTTRRGPGGQGDKAGEG